MIDVEAIYPWREVEQQYKCAHEETQLVKYQQSHGAWRVRYQQAQAQLAYYNPFLNGGTNGKHR